MIRADLEAAGIPFQDDAGRVFDFHALRHQFISNLAAAGVHPKNAQILARHSTITLTMDRYTHQSVQESAAALDKLPALPSTRTKPQEMKATGTTGRDLVRQQTTLPVQARMQNQSEVMEEENTQLPFPQRGYESESAPGEDNFLIRRFRVRIAAGVLAHHLYKARRNVLRANSLIVSIALPPEKAPCASKATRSRGK
jgi:hypothetical protein